MTPPTLFEAPKNGLPGLTRRQVEFAIERISSRARTPPRNLGFWKKSLPVFFSADVFSGEIESFLSDEAYRVLERGEASLGSLVEHLKCAAAEYDLPYGTLVLNRAIESSMSRRERESALRTALLIGGRANRTAPLRTGEVAPISRAREPHDPGIGSRESISTSPFSTPYLPSPSTSNYWSGKIIP
jgi:hypothetical protein